MMLASAGVAVSAIVPAPSADKDANLVALLLLRPKRPSESLNAPVYYWRSLPAQRETVKRAGPRHMMSAMRSVALFLLLASVCLSQDFDLVIANGRVMDPTANLDAVRHIGIR